ncbi:MAG: hypothetical protein H7X80_07360 [bacterium]|nr:hypothetical protein [Candidatus Kapabacteria bacterium]
MENSSTTIATAAGAESGVLTPSSPESVRHDRARSADNASLAIASGVNRIAPKTMDEWKSESMWPSAVISAGNVEYPKVEGITLFSKIGLDKPLHVAQELTAAKLNVSNGVTSACILETIANADAWLDEHPVGTFPTWNEYQIGSRFWWDLYKFNNGLSTCDRGTSR